MKKRTLPRLYVVSNSPQRPYPENELPEFAREITAHGAAIIQLREKHLSAKALYELALRVRSRIENTSSLLIVNERFDIALAAGADGTHFPEDSCPLDKARAAAPGMLAGKSIHSQRSALSAEAEGADYLVAGPVFETPFKTQYGAPLGLEKFSEICRIVSIPVYAIGGITPSNTRQCLDRGAYGVAALSIFRTSESLANTLENFNNMLNQCT